MTGSPIEGQLVVARFVDGRLLKGTTRDFGPNKPKFHLFPWGEETDKPLDIPVGALKALFFVKSYDGDSDFVPAQSFDDARGQGRKVVVTFKDGEVMAGFTMGYNPKSQGFFLIPVDPGGNNARVFAVNAAVRKVENAVGEARPPGAAGNAASR